MRKIKTKEFVEFVRYIADTLSAIEETDESLAETLEILMVTAINDGLRESGLINGGPALAGDSLHFADHLRWLSGNLDYDVESTVVCIAAWCNGEDQAP